MVPPVTDEPASSGSADGGEDDYMSMVISEPTTHEKETSIQRRARKQREVGWHHIGSLSKHSGRAACGEPPEQTELDGFTPSGTRSSILAGGGGGSRTCSVRINPASICIPSKVS